MTATFDYTGRSDFVAGGTSGINLGIAKAFAAAGARVGVASRSQEKVDAAVAALAGAGPALGYAFDVRDPVAVADALDAFAGEVGGIDVLVSGAAGNFPALAKDYSPNGFKAVIDIDLLGTFHVMGGLSAHAAARRQPHQHLRAAGAGGDGTPGACLRRQGRRRHGDALLGHRVGARGPPGQRRDPRPDRRHRGHGPARADPEARARAATSVPLRRMGNPDDVADVCLFLGSDAARYVSGAILPPTAAGS